VIDIMLERLEAADGSIELRMPYFVRKAFFTWAILPALGLLLFNNVVFISMLIEEAKSIGIEASYKTYN
ncbi:MAG TPA: hypothetical protein PLD88_01520, partial [Candidatus Berkiella sp.]|nr:hypothetical protein [Candidatus Berkiella sp.]